MMRWHLRSLLIVSALLMTVGVSKGQFGMIDADLVYTPLPEACRLLDTRFDTRGALQPNQIRVLSVNQGLLAQGGASSDCGIPAPNTAQVAALVINLTSVGASGPGNIGIGPHRPSGALPPNISYLNFGTVPSALQNSVIIPVCTAMTPEGPCQPGEDFDVIARGSSVHLVGDVVGYFGQPTATPLDCEQMMTTQNVAHNANFGFNSPTCSAGFTAITPQYDMTDETGGKVTHVQASLNSLFIATDQTAFCGGRNESGGPLAVICALRCCRLPGK